MMDELVDLAKEICIHAYDLTEDGRSQCNFCSRCETFADMDSGQVQFPHAPDCAVLKARRILRINETREQNANANSSRIDS